MKKIKTLVQDCSGKYRAPVLSGNRGFTFMELVMVIVILGILSAVAVPKLGDFIDSSRINSTRQEMMTIKQALIGDSTARIGAVVIDQGFIIDNLSSPNNLDMTSFNPNDLVTKPGSWTVYNRVTRKGWSGPYISDDGSQSYLTDSWDRAYIFSQNAVSASGPNLENTIKSLGPDGIANTGGADDDDIIISY